MSDKCGYFKEYRHGAFCEFYQQNFQRMWDGKMLPDCERCVHNEDTIGGSGAMRMRGTT